MMLFRDDDMIERTYSVKGYKKRRTIGVKTLLLSLFIIIGSLAALLVIFMSMNGLI